MIVVHMIRNARFWVFVNDAFVRITLAPGQSITHVTGGPHEEGYSYTAETWAHEGDRIVREIHTTGRDCDGRLDTYQCLTCPLDWLGHRLVYESGVPIWAPRWESTESSQRDYTAEAAGY